MKKFLIIGLLVASVSGCGKFSPLSPELDQKIDNQNGQIEELKNNQNGIMLDLLKLRQDAQINADKIDNFQQGLLNLKGNSNENSGIQILQGDGPLIMIFALITIGMMLIYHYRTKYMKYEKLSDIIAQQVVGYNDRDLDNKIFLAALNTEVEKELHDLFVKHQSLS